MYEVKETFWQFVDHWQTLTAALIAGGLALGAAALTVWATIRSKRLRKRLTARSPLRGSKPRPLRTRLTVRLPLRGSKPRPLRTRLTVRLPLRGSKPRPLRTRPTVRLPPRAGR